MALDKYMVGIKEGEKNDWAETQNGYLQTEYDLAMIRQEIDARVKTLPGEVDDFDGIDYLNIIFAKTPVLTKAQAVIDAIKTINTVKEVVFNSYDFNKTTGILKMNFAVNTVLGDVNYEMSLDEENKTVSSNFS